MIVTYAYRILPSKTQHRALEALLESQRELYNAALEERIGAYRRGVTRTCFDQFKALTELRRSQPEYSLVPVTLQRATIKRLDEAYKSFYRRVKAKGPKAGFPRFRGKRRWNSFGFAEFQSISFDGKHVRFKGMPSRLRIHTHRPLPEGCSIRSCMFRRDAKGWCIAFAIEVEAGLARTTGRAVGIDLGITTFATLSDGGVVPSLRAARRFERRLRIAQRAFCRKKKGSRGRQKARVQVMRCHAATTRARTNFLHQASARLIRNYDLIAVENLNFNGLARSCLARDVMDASWAKFVSMLRYKAERAGVQLIGVDPRKTSQTCSGCGAWVPKELGVRRHDCPHCGLSVDRDLNAARNILHRAGVGPRLHNVACDGKRADRNLGLAME